MPPEPRRHQAHRSLRSPRSRTAGPAIEFTRGCPWDCSFCSAWTFYGRSYRRLSSEAAAEDMARIPEPGAFMDDVAFIKAEEVTRSPGSSSAARSASSTIWKPDVTCCSATRRCSAAGGASG
jgi:pyruvate-formate lyase-activating enzyme